MFFTYILKSRKTGDLYKGSTEDVAIRLARHNEGLSRSTKAGRPWELVYEEAFPTRAEAVCRERYFKSGRGRDELQRILSKPTERAIH